MPRTRETLLPRCPEENIASLFDTSKIPCPITFGFPRTFWGMKLYCIIFSLSYDGLQAHDLCLLSYTRTRNACGEKWAPPAIQQVGAFAFYVSFGSF